MTQLSNTSQSHVSTLSMVEAREQFTQLPERFEQAMREREKTPVVKVTRRNKPVMAVLPWELYEAMVETLEILEDKELLEQLQQSLQDIAKGDVKPLHQVEEELGWNKTDLESDIVDDAE